MVIYHLARSRLMAVKGLSQTNKILNCFYIFGTDKCSLSAKKVLKYVQLFVILIFLIITTRTLLFFSMLPIFVQIDYITFPKTELIRPVCDGLKSGNGAWACLLNNMNVLSKKKHSRILVG